MMRSRLTALIRACHHPRGQLQAVAYAFLLLYILSWFLPASDVAADPAVKSFGTKTVVIRKQMDASRGTPAGNVRAVFTVEVAADDALREKGLSGRDSLLPDSAMLFVLEPGRPVAFWMKDMKFPIDIIVFDKDRKVISVMKNLQPCIQCTIYNVSIRAAYALEINAGLTEKIGISIGDRFSLEERKR